MNQTQKFLAIIFFCLLFSISLQVPAYSQSTATSSSGIEEITENVKKRIQGVIQDKLNEKAQAVIYGKLNSITTNTLSVAQNTSVKLASTSAETTFVRLPGNTKLTFDDLAIDEYVIIAGVENENGVLNAVKVVSQKNPPTESKQSSFYGNLYTYDTKKFLLTLKNPQDFTEKVFQVGRKSNLFLGNPDGTKTKIDRKQDLPVQSQVLVLYETPGDPDTDPLVQEMLIIPSSPIITPAELKP